MADANSSSHQHKRSKKSKKKKKHKKKQKRKRSKSRSVSSSEATAIESEDDEDEETPKNEVEQNAEQKAGDDAMMDEKIVSLQNDKEIKSSTPEVTHTSSPSIAAETGPD